MNQVGSSDPPPAPETATAPPLPERITRPGPTDDELSQVRRVAVEASRHRRIPSAEEALAQQLGAKLLSLAVPAGLSDGDVARVGTRVYRISVGHQRYIDDVNERISTAVLVTPAHEVIAAGEILEISRTPVQTETLRQFIDDFPAVAELFSRRATEHFLHDHQAPSSELRRIGAACHRVERSLMENHESLLLTIGGLVLAVALPPLGILGIPWFVEAGLGGVAALFAHGAIGAVGEDLDRHRKAIVVRKHMDVPARASAIEALDQWADGIVRERHAHQPEHQPVTRPHTDARRPATLGKSGLA